MQGAIQKWVDHSISVTVNLPNEVEEDLVGEIYIEAWKSGCKGSTVYRDGSRSGVLISNKDKKETSSSDPYTPQKRPTILEAEVVRFSNNDEKWVAFVGLLDGEPYEVFTGRVDEDVLFIPKSVEKGIIIKNKEEDGTKRYDFQYIDKHGYKATFEGLSRLFDKEFWNYAKLISSVLRHKMPIPNVVDLVSSLKLDSPDGTKAKTGSKCEECGSDSLTYQEGCLICKNCGYSKCG